MTTPTTTEAKEAVNIFASIDVLGLLADTDYPGLNGSSIQDAIKSHYRNLPVTQNGDYADMLEFVMKKDLQKWKNN